MVASEQQKRSFSARENCQCCFGREEASCWVIRGRVRKGAKSRSAWDARSLLRHVVEARGRCFA